MKLLSTAALLLAATSVALVGAISESERRYSRFLEEGIEITPRDIIAYKSDPDDMNSETKWCMTFGQGQGGATKCLPYGETEDGRRSLEIHRPNRVRKTQELVITRPSKETGLFFAREIIVEIENVDISTSPTVVFTGINGNAHNYSFPLGEEDDIGDGVAVQILGGLLVGDYTMKLVAQDGTVLIAMPATEVITVAESPDMSGVVRTTDGHTKVSDDHYTFGGHVEQASGRIYFNVKGKWYGCTGSAIRDGKTGRSLILTAAHCVFADETSQWAFGTKAIFIPNRNNVALAEGETGANIHLSCTQDVCGCWKLSGGVVHDKWPDTKWPDRLAYDYGFYVVSDYGMHKENVCNNSTALDVAVDDLDFAVSEGRNIIGQFGYSLGYSLYYNPFFRYCADTITSDTSTLRGTETAWIPACTLSGGSSGGPWMTDFDEETGTGKLVTVNSWSKNYEDGNGGPFISESEGRCLINAAREVDLDMLDAAAAGDEGLFANCYNRPCVDPGAEDEEGTTRKLRGGETRELCGQNHQLHQTAAERRRQEN